MEAISKERIFFLPILPWWQAFFWKSFSLVVEKFSSWHTSCFAFGLLNITKQLFSTSLHTSCKALKNYNPHKKPCFPVSFAQKHFLSKIIPSNFTQGDTITSFSIFDSTAKLSPPFSRPRIVRLKTEIGLFSPFTVLGLYDSDYHDYHQDHAGGAKRGWENLAAFRPAIRRWIFLSTGLFSRAVFSLEDEGKSEVKRDREKGRIGRRKRKWFLVSAPSFSLSLSVHMVSVETVDLEALALMKLDLRGVRGCVRIDWENSFPKWDQRRSAEWCASISIVFIKSRSSLMSCFSSQLQNKG